MDRKSKKSLATRRRHQVTVQEMVSVSDNIGGETISWRDLHTDIWAEIIPIQAKQQFQNKSVGVDATHLVNIDGLIVILEKYRIMFGSRVLEVLTVEKIQERAFEQVITCKEVR